MNALTWDNEIVTIARPAPRFERQYRSALALGVNAAANYLPSEFWSLDGGRVATMRAPAAAPASKGEHRYHEMDAAALDAFGALHAVVERDEAIDAYGSLEAYHLHVKVWRLARLAVMLQDRRQDAEDIGACLCDLSDAACEAFERGDNALIVAEHRQCGGHERRKTNIKASEDNHGAGCECPLHDIDAFDNVADALSSAIAAAVAADADWQALTADERRAHLAKARSRSTSPRVHYAGDVSSKDGDRALIERLQRAAAAEQTEQSERSAERSAPPPALLEALEALEAAASNEDDGEDDDEALAALVSGHTCGAKRRGESWALYFGRRDACEACKAGHQTYGAPTVAVPVWDGLQGDRKASFGRSPEVGRLGNRRLS